MCQAFSCLPNEGGLYDQDPYLITGVQAVFRVQAKKAKRDHDKQIAEQKSARGQ